jgi:hypothetical protein
MLKMLRLFEADLAFSDANFGTTGDCATSFDAFAEDIRRNTGLEAFSVSTMVGLKEFSRAEKMSMQSSRMGSGENDIRDGDFLRDSAAIGSAHWVSAGGVSGALRAMPIVESDWCSGDESSSKSANDTPGLSKLNWNSCIGVAVCEVFVMARTETLSNETRPPRRPLSSAGLLLRTDSAYRLDFEDAKLSSSLQTGLSTEIVLCDELEDMQGAREATGLATSSMWAVPKVGVRWDGCKWLSLSRIDDWRESVWVEEDELINDLTEGCSRCISFEPLPCSCTGRS